MVAKSLLLTDRAAGVHLSEEWMDGEVSCESQNENIECSLTMTELSYPVFSRMTGMMYKELCGFNTISSFVVWGSHRQMSACFLCL